MQPGVAVAVRVDDKITPSGETFVTRFDWASAATSTARGGSGSSFLPDMIPSPPFTPLSGSPPSTLASLPPTPIADSPLTSLRFGPHHPYVSGLVDSDLTLTDSSALQSRKHAFNLPSPPSTPPLPVQTEALSSEKSRHPLLSDLSPMRPAACSPPDGVSTFHRPSPVAFEAVPSSSVTTEIASRARIRTLERELRDAHASAASAGAATKAAESSVSAARRENHAMRSRLHAYQSVIASALAPWLALLPARAAAVAVDRVRSGGPGGAHSVIAAVAADAAAAIKAAAANASAAQSAVAEATAARAALAKEKEAVKAAESATVGVEARAATAEAEARVIALEAKVAALIAERQIAIPVVTSAVSEDSSHGAAVEDVSLLSAPPVTKPHPPTATPVFAPAPAVAPHHADSPEREAKQVSVLAPSSARATPAAVAAVSQPTAVSEAATTSALTALAGPTFVPSSLVSPCPATPAAATTASLPSPVAPSTPMGSSYRGPPSVSAAELVALRLEMEELRQKVQLTSSSAREITGGSEVKKEAVPFAPDSIVVSCTSHTDASRDVVGDEASTMGAAKLSDAARAALLNESAKVLDETLALLALSTAPPTFTPVTSSDAVPAPHLDLQQQYIAPTSSFPQLQSHQPASGPSAGLTGSLAAEIAALKGLVHGH